MQQLSVQQPKMQQIYINIHRCHRPGCSSYIRNRNRCNARDATKIDAASIDATAIGSGSIEARVLHTTSLDAKAQDSTTIDVTDSHRCNSRSTTAIDEKALDATAIDATVIDATFIALAVWPPPC